METAMPRRPGLFVSATLAAVLALGIGGGRAQDTAIRLGQSLQLTGTQLEVTADELNVDQATGTTVFSGNVLAVQGELRITAGTLRLNYVPGANPGSQRIDRLTADGGVTLVTPAEAIEAREAVYVLGRGTLEMTGDVLLVQGANVLSGQRFTADLNTGAGRMSGRVRTVIQLD
jgi:lipopolysaccharide export system protein LptA